MFLVSTTSQIYFVRIMHQTIQDGVGHRRIADLLMPMFHRQLTGDDGGSMIVPFSTTKH